MNKLKKLQSVKQKKDKAKKSWKCKDGRIIYPLANCMLCGKKSATTDKETAMLSHRYGRNCRDCTEKIHNGMDIFRRDKDKTFWEKFKSIFR